jgi:hypothetical protein
MRATYTSNHRPAFFYKKQGQGVIYGISFIVFFWILVAITVLFLSGFSLRTGLILADTTVLLAPLVIKMASGTLDIFEPLIFSNIALGAMMVARPIADISAERYIEHGFSFAASFDQALLVVLIGNLAFQCGYFSKFGDYLARLLIQQPAPFDFKTTSLWASFLTALGVALYSVFLASAGGLGLLLSMLSGRSSVSNSAHHDSSAYLYGAASLLIPACLMFFGMWVMRRKMLYLLGAIVSGGPYLISGF